MKNFNEFGVQEMDALEVKEMNGGFNDRPYGRPDYGEYDVNGGSSSRKGMNLAEFVFWWTVFS